MSHGLEVNMNGEVNGSMEESMDTSSPPASPKAKKPISLNHCNADETNHRDQKPKVEALNNINNDNTDNDTNQDAQQTNHNTNISESSTPSIEEQKDSNNIYSNNHCSNSNGSHVDDESQDSQELGKINDMKENDTKDDDNNSHHASMGSEIDDTERAIMAADLNLHEEVIIKDEEVECEGTYLTNKEDTEEEVDSEEDSSEEGSERSREQRAEDTVSINSNSDEDSKNQNSDVVILDNAENGDDEVHEIDSDNDDNDDCIIENEDKSESAQTMTVRRSSRTIKRRKYDDEDSDNGEEESDIEEVTMEDPLHPFQKNKTIIVNDTKSLVEAASKQLKGCQGLNDKKEPTVVIIDTNSILSGKVALNQAKTTVIAGNNSHNAQDLYQSIAARGTTVTPVPTKNLTNSATQSSPQPAILPSLTDDMFVVEAPSFIVPYVYEKPSIKPFREFVDTLGKELEEQKAKEDEEKEKEIKEEEKAEAKDEGEEDEVKSKDEDMDVDGEKETKTPTEEVDEVEPPKKKKEKRDRRNNDDDDASWDGESSEDSDDEAISDDDEKTVVIKEKDDSIDDIKDTISDISADKISGFKSDNYFDCSLGKFFINVGVNLVQEYVQNDLLKQQNRKLYREKKTGMNTRPTESAINSLMKNLQFSKDNNSPYSFKQHKCEFCSFKTESMLSMSYHLETPHMKNNVYKCNFCAFEIRSPHDILYHMEAEHNIRGRLERAPAYHQCANCPFEDNGKGKLARHLIPCAKKFKPDLNLAPPVEWEPPAKIPKITRARNNMLGSYQSSFNRSPIGVNNVGRPPITNNAIMQSGIGSYRPRGRSPMAVAPRAMPAHGTPIMRSGVMIRHNSPNAIVNNYPLLNNQSKNPIVGSPKLLHHQPSISITPLPRPPQPTAAQPAQHAKGTFVICEICDGYIKDLEQLRNHMQWIHKVKIHPKMIYNRPPLNCQKCQFRFFTDQGLERHLLGSHGLVTSSMQEAANRGKDAGRCPVCGRVYQWKLLNHVARDHSLTLKPAHLSYKCTVCTATFGMYKQFENHVYSAHSVVAKRVIDKTKTSSPKPTDSLLKPLKINDEITIIPQPPKPANPPPKGK